MTATFRTALLLRMVAMAGLAGGQLLLVRLIVERLGDHALASWMLVSQVVILLLMLDLGVGTALVRQVARHGADPGFWQALHRLLWWSGLVGAVMLLGIAGIGPQLMDFSGREAWDLRLLAVLFAAHLAVRFRCGLPMWRWYQRDDPRPSAWIEAGLSGLRPLGAAAAAAAGAQLLVIGLVWCALELLVLWWACQALRQTRAASSPTSPTSSPMEAVVPTEAIAPAIHLRRIAGDVFSSSGISLVSSIPVYVAGWMIGTATDVTAVNAWQCSFALPLLCLRVAYLPLSTFFPAVVLRLQQSSAVELARRHAGWVLAYLTALLIGVGLLALLNQWFVAWWMGDPRFFAGAAVTCWIAGWVALSAIRSALGHVIVAGEQRRLPIILAHGAEAVVLLIASGWLLRQHGLAGFAMGMTVAHLIPLLVSVPLVLRMRAPSSLLSPHPLHSP